MINHISIQNFAIIENIQVEFEDGLNIVTGETGSGKSILIEAISLALGSRADSNSIRTGAEKAIVQLSGTYLGEEFVITREVSISGKNLCKLNGEIVTLAQLNHFSKNIADIHGQYDNQSLLNPESHLDLLDSFQKDSVQSLREEVSTTFHQYAALRSQLSSLLSMEKENARKKDFYCYEIEEINKANLTLGEDLLLQQKIDLLQNSEKIYEGLEHSYITLFDHSSSVLDGLGSSLHSLESVASYSEELQDISSEISDMFYRLQDLSHRIRSFKEQITFSPSELDLAISRADLIETLKKKYGDTIEEILAYRDDISSKISIIENFDDEKTNLEKQVSQSRNQLLDLCNKLSSRRHQVAKELKDKIQSELIALNFVDAELEIRIHPLAAPCETGIDQVEIFISTNKGEGLKPLAKIASGGEMSRIMLAFKNLISGSDMIPTMIFDEIDTGISGITASIVGQKLKEISKEHQIICITHLPQIAACGDYNYRIYKESDALKTFTSLEKLNEDEKINEITRLLGGTNITLTTMESAKELISSSK